MKKKIRRFVHFIYMVYVAITQFPMDCVNVNANKYVGTLPESGGYQTFAHVARIPAIEAVLICILATFYFPHLQ